MNGYLIFLLITTWLVIPYALITPPLWLLMELGKMLLHVSNSRTSRDEYWDILLNVFMVPNISNPLVDFTYKLRKVKDLIKTNMWAYANSIKKSLKVLLESQNYFTSTLDYD